MKVIVLYLLQKIISEENNYSHFITKKVLTAIIIWEFELLSSSWFIEKQLLIN